jgi:hypothetical protein
MLLVVLLGRILEDSAIVLVGANTPVDGADAPLDEACTPLLVDDI